MKKLILPVLALATALAATLPSAAQVPSELPATPTPTATPTATATPTTAATPAATTGPTQIYAARTATRGLALTIAGQGLQVGMTTTRVASDATDQCAGVACATAAGVAEPAGTTVTATSPGEGSPAAVEGGNFDPLEAAFAGQFGAASAMTTETPTAQASADGLTLDVTLTQSIVQNLPAEVTDGLNGAIGSLAEGLAPVAEGDPTGAVGGLLDTLQGLTDDLANSPLARIQGGQATSSSVFADGTLTSTSTTGGVVVIILPTATSTPLVPEGLAVVEIGSSSATATADGTNPATGEAVGSIGRVTLLPGILDALPDINPGEAEGLPLGDVIGLLPEPLQEVLPGEVLDALGAGGDPSEAPSPTPTPTATATEGGPLDDILPTFMQADNESGGFVIDLQTGTEQTCFLEDTPLATCVTLGGTSTTFSDDNLGVGVLAAGTDISIARDANGVGQIELSVARSEAGAAAAFVVAGATPTPIPTEGMPDTGGGSSAMLPALGMLMVGGTALWGLRRRREA